MTGRDAGVDDGGVFALNDVKRAVSFVDVVDAIVNFQMPSR
ncbi:MAG: hypothetical protein ACLS6G_09145 [Christensenellales bacterium]